MVGDIVHREDWVMRQLYNLSYLCTEILHSLCAVLVNHKGSQMYHLVYRDLDILGGKYLLAFIVNDAPKIYENSTLFVKPFIQYNRLLGN